MPPTLAVLGKKNGSNDVQFLCRTLYYPVVSGLLILKLATMQQMVPGFYFVLQHLFNCIGYIVYNVNSEMEKMRKETVVANFKSLPKASLCGL
jgi:hypothetical protein